MTEKANDVLERARSRNERVQDYLRPAADFFHRNEGTMFGRKEAREEIGKELDVDEKTAGAVIAQLVSDKVDPIVQVATDDEKFVGVAEFHEFDGAYGYLEYDDAIGARRRVVCQKCVNDSDFDNEVTHATEQSPDPESSTFKQDVEYTDLVDKVHQHYQSSHESMPTEIATGATLASGTTVGGNISFHAGNDGPGSGLDADTLEGQAASVFVTNRYSDSEARTAISGSSIDGSNFTGIAGITAEESVASDFILGFF
jgi:hypothetical protein